jgi:hypothetical protein
MLWACALVAFSACTDVAPAFSPVVAPEPHEQNTAPKTLKLAPIEGNEHSASYVWISVGVPNKLVYSSLTKVLHDSELFTLVLDDSSSDYVLTANVLEQDATIQEGRFDAEYSLSDSKGQVVWKKRLDTVYTQQAGVASAILEGAGNLQWEAIEGAFKKHQLELIRNLRIFEHPSAIASCQAGDPIACQKLAVAQCDNGDAHVCEMLAVLHSKLEPICKAGSAEACKSLASEWPDPSRWEVASQMAKAQHECSQGDPKACSALSLKVRLENGLVKWQVQTFTAQQSHQP